MYRYVQIRESKIRLSRSETGSRNYIMRRSGSRVSADYLHTEQQRIYRSIPVRNLRLCEGKYSSCMAIYVHTQTVKYEYANRITLVVAKVY
jgi:hypothetical protein